MCRTGIKVPERYDHIFEPQNTILTLDYLLLKDLSRDMGIDRIYKFLLCIQLEQEFLRRFPKRYVLDVLRNYNIEYKETPDNICGIVFAATTGRALLSMEDIAICLKCDRVNI